MHHVDLVLDPASDRAVREAWQVLEDAALPNQGRHRSASNRPHVTLTMTEHWPGGAALDAALGPLARLPLPARLGGLVVLGHGPFVLARLVVVTPALLDLHATLGRALGPPATELLLPGRWTPHVTLGRRLSADEVATALGRLGPAGERDVVLAAARHWDSRARLDEALTGPDAATGPGLPAP